MLRSCRGGGGLKVVLFNLFIEFDFYLFGFFLCYCNYLVTRIGSFLYYSFGLVKGSRAIWLLYGDSGLMAT